MPIEPAASEVNDQSFDEVLRTTPLRTGALFLRSTLFYFGYSALTGWFSLTALVFCSWLPYRVRSIYLGWWNHLTLRWLWLVCGVRFEVRGREHLPAGPCVILSKHQSQWETFFLQVLKPPAVTVLKKELVRVPFFGWGLRLLTPIAIDRNQPKQALRQIQEEGVQRLGEGKSVIIFPEGTRMNPGQSGKYARSGAELACRGGVPIVPVAHNAGYCWPTRKFLKYPGTITVVIGAPMDTAGGDSRALTEQTREWIEGEVAKLDRR